MQVLVMWQRLRAFYVPQIIATFLMAASPSVGPIASASEPPRPNLWSAMVRIVNQKSDESCLGSGAVVAYQDDVRVVLTCAHLFTEGVGEIYVLGPNGSPTRALLLALDEKNDLACLVQRMHEGVALPVAEELPAGRSSLAYCGFGQDGSFQATQGTLMGYATLSGGETLGVLEMTGGARHGDSGGPILNARGEIVAVIMGTDGECVDGTHCRQIRDFLAQHAVTPSLRAQAANLANEPINERLLSLDVSFQHSRASTSKQ